MAWDITGATVLTAALGAWMLFDGIRALVTGEYTTPSSGRYKGQLGPWAGLVLRLGIDSRSTAMKAIFVGFGVAWLLVAAGLAFDTAGVPQLAMVLAVATLWYAPIGSAIALAVLLLVGAEILG